MTVDGETLARAVATRPFARLVADFYREYRLAFVLPNERETLAGFRACLRLNDPAENAALHRRFGPYREYIAIFRQPGSEAFVGGANFVCYPMADLAAVTIQSNYVFVAAASRGRGRLRRIYAEMQQVARGFASETGMDADHAVVAFIGEQNDPFRMTLRSYLEDSKAAQLDQFDRLGIWGRMGARILQHDYVQPALSDRQEADDTLFLRMTLAGDTPGGLISAGLDPRILREHLRRFFAVSVLKGRPDALEIPVVSRQLASLDEMIAAGTRLRLTEMPAPQTLESWKRRAVAAAADPALPPETRLGDILGEDSVPAAARRAEGAS